MDPQRTQWLRRLGTLGALLGALALAFYFFLSQPNKARFDLTLSAGDALGRRHALAQVLAEEAQPLGLTLELKPTSGSAEACARVERGEIDLALIQGGLPAGKNVRQVATLLVEPLHLLVRPELRGAGIDGLRGKRINVSTEGSGTRALALETLAFAGLIAGKDFVAEGRSYGELEQLPADELPDAIFVVSSLPSQVVAFLIEQRGYRIADVPFGQALALRDAKVEVATIPAFTYGVLPQAIPPSDTPTVGNHLLLVAHRDVDALAVRRLLEATFEHSFASKADLKHLGPELQHRELPLHPGSRAWLARHQPVITTETIDNLESMRSFLVSIAVALFLLWRWQRRRRFAGFEDYLARVNAIEKQALEIEQGSSLNLPQLIEIRKQLSALKVEALENFARGELRGEDLMASFLTHVSDVRSYLNTMILHERDRLEHAAAAAPDAGASGRFDALWDNALRDRDAAAGEPPSS